MKGNPMWKCKGCKEELEDQFDVCWNCDTKRDESPSRSSGSNSTDKSSNSSGISESSKGERNIVKSRYTDAYLTARTIVGFGGIIKFVAVAIVVGAILIGIAAASKMGSNFIITASLWGTVTGIPIYILGILVAAQGQILKATLDTAVYNSPFITKDEMKEMMSLD